ncbi:MAG: Slp family lipoprotein, partial [Proteobacteria bacterium]|nr:Slp family lipoprotein [Pseudomonadota bacterium]
MPRHLCFALLTLIPFLLGWDHVLSPDAFFAVRPGVTYAQVRRDPDGHRGVTLMLAGVIAENTSTREGTTLEVQCYTRDRDDRPEEFDPDCGRFLARTSVILDPESYRLGRQVTLTGTLRGQATRPLGGQEYLYPVFQIGEIHLWPRPEEGCRCPPPWRYDPWCDPFGDPLDRYPYHRRC